MRTLKALVFVSLLVVAGVVVMACEESEDKAQPDVMEVVEDLTTDDLCAPQCAGRECGPDGCGGYCGSCQEGYACNKDGQCDELPQCELVAAVACGELVQGDTSGRDNELSGYSCEEYAGEGGDIVYVFQPQIDDNIRIEFNAQFSELKLLVTEAPCKPATCLGSGDSEVELTVEGGRKYYIVVDGEAGEEGPFSLEVVCQSTCQPSCTWQECGEDGCGGSCGECPEAAPFCIDGFCEVQCTPDCFGKNCGDDGCGGSCGSCEAGIDCVEGVCVDMAGCVATGEPGCGGCACEACVCAEDSYCCSTAWDEICANLCATPCGGCKPVTECGDGLCQVGEDCGSCPEDCGCNEDQLCVAGVCCTPSCNGKECGDDGCGGSCGDCPEGEACNNGQCTLDQPGCVESDEPGCGGCWCEACVCEMDAYCCSSSWDSICVDECVDDCGGCTKPVGCGDLECVPEDGEDCESCPADCGCGDGAICLEGGTCCTLQCEGKECGEDGCGGECGDCGNGECIEGTCYAAGALCLSLEPAAIDFGQVQVGSLATQTFVISNCGTETLAVVALAMAEGGSEYIGIDPSELPVVPSPETPLEVTTEDSWAVNVLFLPGEASAQVEGEFVPESAAVEVTLALPAKTQLVEVSGIGVPVVCPEAVIVVQEGEEVTVGTVLHLDGSTSSVEDGTIVGYDWTVASQPDGADAVFVPNNLVVDPTLEVTEPGIYELELVVTDADGNESCEPGTATVTVSAAVE